MNTVISNMNFTLLPGFKALAAYSRSWRAFQSLLCSSVVVAHFKAVEFRPLITSSVTEIRTINLI